MEDRITARDIIEAILRNLEESVEPLLYTAQVPSIYQVYLHSDDYKRLQGFFPKIINETEAALDDKLRQMNKGSRLGSLLKKRLRYESVEDSWCLEFYADPNVELQKGQILVESQLPIKKDEAGVGVETQRVRTVRANGDSKTTRRDRQAPPAYARITYTDDRGRQTYLMSKSQIIIGRGGKGIWVDVKLYTKADVSRKHLRLRLDQGKFFIKDLSSLGTTVNGKELPKGVEIIGDEKIEKEVEEVLPPKAQIALADVLTISFEALK